MSEVLAIYDEPSTTMDDKCRRMELVLARGAGGGFDRGLVEDLMMPTDTHGHSGDVGGDSVALTWSSVVDGRPDRPSRGRRRIVPGVCRQRECSSNLKEYPLLESARFVPPSHHRPRQLYSAARLDTPSKPSGTIRTTSAGRCKGDVV